MNPDSATERQVQASRPERSTWLAANAGSGKTRVLTNRVARLLLRGARPEQILCLTYTKAAAAEMQNRLFRTLGSWAIEAPGGLKIQTIHAFCAQLLRRFPPTVADLALLESVLLTGASAREPHQAKVDKFPTKALVEVRRTGSSHAVP